MSDRNHYNWLAEAQQYAEQAHEHESVAVYKAQAFATLSIAESLARIADAFDHPLQHVPPGNVRSIFGDVHDDA